MKKTKIVGLLLVAVVASAFAAGTQQRTAVEESFTLMLSEHPATPLNNEMPVLDLIEEKTGVRIILQPVPSAEYQLKVNTALASRDLADVLQVNLVDQVRPYAPRGAFVELSKYPQLVGNAVEMIQQLHPTEWPLLKQDGSLYYFPFSFLNQPVQGVGPILRIDLLERHDLPVPGTWEDLYDVLTELHRHYPDATPVVMRAWGGQFTHAVFYGLGTVYGLGWDHDAEKYLYGAIHPEFRDALEYLNRLYREALLDPDFVASTTARFEEKITGGNNFVFFENFLPDWQTRVEDNVPGAEYDFRSFLTNSRGERRGWIFQRGNIGNGYAVNAQLREYEYILRTLDWMYTEEGYLVNSWGREGDTYEIVDGRPWFTDRILSMPVSEQTNYMFNTFGTANRSVAPLDDARNWFGFGIAIEDKGKPIDTRFTRINDRFAGDPGGGTAYTRPAVEPPLTREEMERVTELRTRIDTIMEPGVIDFITGRRSLTQFDAFVRDLKNAGAEELETIYNNALQR